MLKRCFDLTTAGIVVIMFSAVFAAIALIVRLDSPGPIFYRGVRVGLYRRPFRILKFRTMVANAEAIGGTSTADTDPRITRVGKILRLLKLDELPQFFNVIAGDMSIVGPRPEVAEYVALYSRREERILSVRPGITDLSSIRFRNLNRILSGSSDPDGYYRDVVRPRKNRLRLYYVRHQNFCLDLLIIQRTITAVLIPPRQKLRV